MTPVPRQSRRRGAAGWQGLLTGEPGMRRVLDLARRAARTTANVFIVGENGTGKSLLARAIHADSPRAGRPFVEIPCANIPETLIESELFGHEKGAFTGAVRARAGRFEIADGGSVLIDGVTELPRSMQAKLLRVLQERTIERLGAERSRAIDVRIFASSPPGIDDLVASGRFREDLYYRLNVLRLELPPLRARPGDARRLARLFLAALRRRGGPTRFSREALEYVDRCPWPGNVRQLHNCVEAALIACRNGTIGLEDLPASPSREEDRLIAHAAAQGYSLARLEEAYIREILRRTGGNRSESARILGIARKTLLEKMRRCGINR